MFYLFENSKAILLRNRLKYHLLLKFFEINFEASYNFMSSWGED